MTRPNLVLVMAVHCVFGLAAAAFPANAVTPGAGPLAQVGPSLGSPWARRPTVPPARPAGSAPQPPSRAGPSLPPDRQPLGAGDRQSCDAISSRQATLVPGPYVTIDYLRMRHPEAVVGIAAQVRLGRLPAAALNGLASPDAVERVKNADWSEALAIRPAAEPDIALRMAAPNSVPPLSAAGVCPDVPSLQRAPMDVRRRLAEGEARPQGGRAEAEAPRAIADATRPLLASLIALDVSPARLDLGSVLVGERRRATFRVTSMQAGTLVIAPEPNSYLRITTATADTGIIGLEPGGASPAPTSAPPSMGAPARVALEAGQSATIVVEFKPTAQEGFTGQPTRYAGALRLTLTPPQARLLDRPAAEALTEVGPRDVSLPTQEVRATATVAGELYGIGVSLDEPTVFAHPGMTFQVFFDVYNNGVEGDATVSINTSRLPPGVTPAGPTTLQVHLGPGEERQYQSFALNGPRQAPDEPQSSMSLLVNQTSRQGSQSTIVPVDVYLNDIARKYSCYDLVEVRDATIEYKCTAFEVSFGYWQVIMNVEVLNGGNCNSFDDSTTVTIHPSPIYTRGGHFYRGNYGGLTYFDQGVSGALANDFLDYAGPISMNHTVTCHYNNPF